MPTEALALTPAWDELRYHPEQARLMDSDARFKVCAAGRRSGKTVRGKRWLVKGFMSYARGAGGLFVACAPTYNQARKIFWSEFSSPPLWALVPDWFVERRRDSDMTLIGINGATLTVVGLDKPQRIEGVAVDRALIDEIAECKPEAWTSTLRPCLSTRGREGDAMFIGRPKGRNFFWQLRKRGLDSENEDWEYFHWDSASILDPAEIEAARSELDEEEFAQEYEADFLTAGGRAYGPYDPLVHGARSLSRVERLPLILCFDFNVDPGPAVVCQEQPCDVAGFSPSVTAVIDEVAIKGDSDTERVCKELAARYADHPAPARCYGDATGGARRTSGTRGTDVDIIREVLRPVFGDRLSMRFAKQNPPERVRVNATRRRLRTADGVLHMMVDRRACPELDADFQEVSRFPGSGELDKRDGSRTHWSDALGYYCHAEFPLGGHVLSEGGI